MTEKRYIITEEQLARIEATDSPVIPIDDGYGMGDVKFPLAPDEDAIWKAGWEDGVIAEHERIESLKEEIREQTEKVLSPYEARMALLDILERIDKMQKSEDRGSD